MNVNAVYNSDIGKTPIFYGGASRSGTTILGKCLGVHPNIVARNEMDWTDYFKAFIDSVNYNGHAGHSGIAINYDQMHNRLAKLLFECSVEKYINSGIFDDGRIQRWGGKVGIADTYYDVLTKLFPRCQFIVIVRNPLIVLESVKNWGRNDYSFEMGCKEWRGKALKTISLKDKPNFFVVRHEKMVNQTNEFWQEICQFINLPLDGSMLQQSAQVINTSFPDDAGKPPAALLDRQIEVESWSPQEKSIFNEYCGELMQQLNYDLPF